MPARAGTTLHRCRPAALSTLNISLPATSAPGKREDVDAVAEACLTAKAKALPRSSRALSVNIGLKVAEIGMNDASTFSLAAG
jgi:hypothetical protein